MPLSGVYSGGGCDTNATHGEVSSGHCGEGAEHDSKRQCLYQCWSSPHGLVLEQDLWSKLPIELLERIIASLPIDAMLRVRTVCKAWKSYISSYGFAHLRYTEPSDGPWCLAVVPEHGEMAAYDATLDKWYHIPLPRVAQKHNMRPFSCVGSLVCFKNTDNSLFFAYNPLTKSCSCLTPKRRGVGSEKDKVWAVTDDSEGFTVVVTRESGRCEVYDSYSNRWSKPGMLPHNVSLSQDSALPARSVSSDGKLYLVSGPPYDVLSYDTINGSWSRLYLHWPERTWNHILSEYRGRIYLFAFHRENSHLVFSEWELQSATMVWVKVETMPALFGLEPSGASGIGGEWQLECYANRSIVLFQFSDRTSKYVVLYNRTLRLWSKISQLPPSVKRWC